MLRSISPSTIARRFLLPVGGLLLAACGAGDGVLADTELASLAGATAPAEEGKADSLGARHLLIADQFNNRVIETDASGRVTWSFGDGASVAGPTSIVAPNDSERVGSYTLIAATGAPAGSEPSCTTDCVDSRVVLVDARGRIVWQYGTTGVTGAGANQLNNPVCAVFLPTGHVLITDQGNARIIEVNGRNEIVWQYGTTGTTGVGANQLNNPNSAELLRNGNILIADENNNRVIEVTRAGTIVWSYGTPDDGKLAGAAFASRLSSGDTLISDANHQRVVEVDRSGKTVWSYDTSKRAGSVKEPQPTRGVRLRGGHTLISDQLNHQVIEVTSAGRIVSSVGHIAVAGSAPGQLNGPYDAKVIGDFTGLTPPFGW